MASELEVFKKSLEMKVESFKAVLVTDHATNHMIQSLVTIVGKNPEWLDESKVYRPSLYQAAMDAAEVGLPLATNLRQAYFVPRWSKKTGKEHVAYEISVHGLKSLAFRGGKIIGFPSNVVYADDVFEFEYGTSAFIKHIPRRPSTNRVVAVWAMAEFANGSKPIFQIVWKEELDKIQKLSKSHFWSNWYDEMARKTAIRRLCKSLDICPELQRAIAIEERNEGELSRESNPHQTGAAASLRAKLIPAAVVSTPPQEERPTGEVPPGEDIAPSPGGDDLDFDEDKIP